VLQLDVGKSSGNGDSKGGAMGGVNGLPPMEGRVVAVKWLTRLQMMEERTAPKVP